MRSIEVMADLLVFKQDLLSLRKDYSIMEGFDETMEHEEDPLLRLLLLELIPFLLNELTRK
jgi:hypothetical protein